MTKAAKFRAVAVRVINKFTDGNYTLRNINSESYNATSGANTVGYLSIVAPMVSTDILNERDLGDITSDKHFAITAAGDHIQGYEPSIGDLVVTPTGDIHKIAKVKSDLYGASYEMFVSKEQWAA